MPVGFLVTIWWHYFSFYMVKVFPSICVLFTFLYCFFQLLCTFLQTWHWSSSQRLRRWVFQARFTPKASSAFFLSCFITCKIHSCCVLDTNRSYKLFCHHLIWFFSTPWTGTHSPIRLQLSMEFSRNISWIIMKINTYWTIKQVSTNFRGLVCYKSLKLEINKKKNPMEIKIYSVK